MLLLLPAALIFISGCTIPGTGINIPLPGFGVISQENDIVVITRLTAIPDTVTAPQQIRLRATIQNQGDKEFAPEKKETTISTSKDPIRVELFDYCQGLFETVIIDKCPREDGGVTGDSQTTCSITHLLPNEIKEVTWTLIPKESTKLITPCDLKVSVTYPYTTSGLTTINFINSEEHEDQLARGSFRSSSSIISLGQGPMKAWYEVKDQQPIPAVSIKSTQQDPKIPITLIIDNRGTGFVKEAQVTVVDTNIFGEIFNVVNQKCPFEPGKPINLIQDERELPCWVKHLSDGQVPKETTHQLTVDISYLYEFRKQVRATVEPPFQV